MSNDNSGSLAALKKAFSEGTEAFKTVVKNDKGFYNNPSNPYSSKSLTFKEWQRGFDFAFFEQQRKIEKGII